MTKSEAKKLNNIKNPIVIVTRISVLVSIIIFLISLTFPSTEPWCFYLLFRFVDASFVYFVCFLLTLIYYIIKTYKACYQFDGDIEKLNVISLKSEAAGGIVIQYKDGDSVKTESAVKVKLDTDGYYIEREHILVYKLFGKYYKSTCIIFHLPVSN